MSALTRTLRELTSRWATDNFFSSKKRTKIVNNLTGKSLQDLLICVFFLFTVTAVVGVEVGQSSSHRATHLAQRCPVDAVLT